MTTAAIRISFAKGGTGGDNKMPSKSSTTTTTTDSSNPIAVSNSGKKRKVWARTVNDNNTNNSLQDASASSSSVVAGMTSSSSDQHQLLASRLMSAESASNYNMEFHRAQVNRMSHSSDTTSAAAASTGSGGRKGSEVKISFGPSRPPSDTSNGSRGIFINGTSMPSAAAIAAAMRATTSGTTTTAGSSGTRTTKTTTTTPSSSSIRYGGIDIESLKERATVATAAASSSGQRGFRNRQGLPCTEAEMKALMGMFVEIMGMSVNNDNGEQGTTTTAPPRMASASIRGESGGTGREKRPDTKGSFYAASTNAGPIFSFGPHPDDTYSIGNPDTTHISPMMMEQMAAATAGFFADGGSWEALRRTYATADQLDETDDYDEDDYDDDDDDESYENRELTFEEIEYLLHHRKQNEEASRLASQFASGDWESLEQVAITDLDSDDREKKATKKREKKQRRKAKQKEEAAQKAAEAAIKKREKAIVSWRSRVVSACQSNETAKLDGLLQESPLRNLQDEESDDGDNLATSAVTSHLEFLFPNVVAKNRAHVERGVEARLRLARYILDLELPLAFKPLRSGRTSLHTACFHGDVQFVTFLLSKLETYQPERGEETIPRNVLNVTCDESGWSPLHYAAMSGSSQTLELLLAKGCEVTTPTDVKHTWRESDGKGITPRELVQYVQSGKHEKVIESHGLALQEMANTFLSNPQERKDFLRRLGNVYRRLAHVETNGYSVVAIDRSDSRADSEPSNQDGAATSAAVGQNEDNSSGIKKKKKKKKKQGTNEAENNDAESILPTPTFGDSTLNTNETVSTEIDQDPLVTALLGMGFDESQIDAAVKACGGTHRATADDLVTWILCQGEVEGDSTTVGSERQQSTNSIDSSRGDSSKKLIQQSAKEEKAEAASAKQQEEEAARRLAAKREEARRRNREWNNKEQARQQQEAKKQIVQKAMVQLRSIHSPSTGLNPSLPNGLSLSSSTGTHVGTSNSPTVVLAGTAPSRLPKDVPRSATQNQGLAVAPEVFATPAPKWTVPRQQPMVGSMHTFAAPTLSSRNITTPPLSGAAAYAARISSSSFPPIADDDRTVSSFGSNRGLSVSSREFVPASFAPPPVSALSTTAPIVPPGFMLTNTQSMSTPLRQPEATVPENSSSVAFSDGVQPSNGEIRATAKAFVPTGFSQPSTSARVPTLEGFVSTNANNMAHPVRVGLSSGLLSQHSSSSGPQSLRGSSFMPVSYEHVQSVTPVSADSSLPGNSLVGVGSLEEPPLGVPLPLGGLGSETNLIGGPSLLGSISRGGAVGGSSIWGESQSMSSLGSTLHPSFFGDGIVDSVGSGQLNGNNDSNVSWGMTGENSKLPNHDHGSIW